MKLIKLKICSFCQGQGASQICGDVKLLTTIKKIGVVCMNNMRALRFEGIDFSALPPFVVIKTKKQESVVNSLGKTNKL